MRKIILLFAIFYFWTFQAAAGGSYSSWGKITRVVVNNNGLLKVFVSGDVVNPGNCKNKSAFALKIDGDNSKLLYSSVLNAFSTQQKSSFFILDNKCTSDMPTVHAIQMKY